MATEVTNDEDWSTYRQYADEASVTVRVVSSPDDPEPVELWFVVAGCAAWDVDWLARQAHLIPLSGLAQDKALLPDHCLDVHERRHEWGAASALIDIVLGIAVWAATSAAWDTTKAPGEANGRTHKTALIRGARRY